MLRLIERGNCVIEQIMIPGVGSLVAASYGLLIYLLKRWFNKMESKIDTIEEKHVTCREQLPDRFAPKTDNQNQHTELFVKLNDVCKEVAFLKGLQVKKRGDL